MRFIRLVIFSSAGVFTHSVTVRRLPRRLWCYPKECDWNCSADPGHYSSNVLYYFGWTDVWYQRPGMQSRCSYINRYRSKFDDSKWVIIPSHLNTERPTLTSSSQAITDLFFKMACPKHGDAHWLLNIMLRILGMQYLQLAVSLCTENLVFPPFDLDNGFELSW